MNIVDSSGRLEYFAGSENASFFAPAIEDTTQLIVPAICIYEVFKRLLAQLGKNTALVNIGDTHQGEIAELTSSIALQAARLATERKIAMTVSIILAMANAYGATLWTQDADFQGIEGVKFIEKFESPQSRSRDDVLWDRLRLGSSKTPWMPSRSISAVDTESPVG